MTIRTDGPDAALRRSVIAAFAHAVRRERDAAASLSRPRLESLEVVEPEDHAARVTDPWICPSRRGLRGSGRRDRSLTLQQVGHGGRNNTRQLTSSKSAVAP